MAQPYQAKKSARGKFYPCAACGKTIEAGQEYWCVEFFDANTVRQHVVCGPLTRAQCDSSKMSGAYLAVEQAEKAVTAATTQKDISAALSACAETVQEVHDEYEEAFDAIPESLQSAPIAEGMTERMQELDDFHATLEAAASEVEDMKLGGETEDMKLGDETEEEFLERVKEYAREQLGEL